MRKIVEFDSDEERNQTVTAIARRLAVLLALFEDVADQCQEDIDLNDPNTWLNDHRFCVALSLEEVQTRSECVETVGEKGRVLQHSVMLALADRQAPLPRCPGDTNEHYAMWMIDQNVTGIELVVSEASFKRWSATSIANRVAYFENCRREANSLVSRIDWTNFRTAVFTHFTGQQKLLSMKDAIVLMKKHVG